MKIIIDKNRLTNALANLVRATSKLRPITGCVLIDASSDSVKLSTTDLNVAMTITLPAQVKEGGSVATDAKQLHRLANSFPKGDVTFATIEDGWAAVSMRSSRLKVPTFPAEDFPTIPAAEGLSDIPTDVLAGLFSRTVFAASDDMSRMSLTGVYLAADGPNLKAVTTDGHRIAATTREGTGVHASAIVPKRAVAILQGLLEGETTGLRVTDGRIFAHCREYVFSSTLVDASFPNYQQAIPANRPRGTVAVNREAMIESLRRLILVGDQEKHSVFLTPGEETLALVSGDAGQPSGDDELPAEVKDEAFSIILNAAYLVEILAVMSNEKVCFELYDTLTPVVLREGPDLWVIMPLRTA